MRLYLRGTIEHGAYAIFDTSVVNKRLPGLVRVGRIFDTYSCDKPGLNFHLACRTRRELLDRLTIALEAFPLEGGL